VGEVIPSYHDDHVKALDHLRSQLQTLGTDRPKILEIGGNASPMLFCGIPGELYNLDVDVHGLQIGNLMDETIKQNPDGITFICADANAIPFPDGYFDCITMFASLHHFPNLRTTLRSLAQKIQPDGFLAMLCEPVGHFYGTEIDPSFREELLKGVNEQSFSLPEYAAIFQDAGLVPDRIIIDGYSLKAFLKKSPAT
jgi:SAM-dependent methyltransferase